MYHLTSRLFYKPDLSSIPIRCIKTVISGYFRPADDGFVIGHAPDPKAPWQRCSIATQEDLTEELVCLTVCL